MMAEWPEEVILTVYDTLILLDSSDHALNTGNENC